MGYEFVFEKNDIKRIDKLNTLTNVETFYDDVRKFTKNIKTDHAIHRWEFLAEKRYEELKEEI